MNPVFLYPWQRYNFQRISHLSLLIIPYSVTFHTKSFKERLLLFIFRSPGAGSTAAASTRSVRNLFRILFKEYCFRRIPADSCGGRDIALNQSGVVDVALQRDVGVG